MSDEQGAWLDDAGRSFRARFWAKVDTGGSCWNWTAGVDGRGYGAFKLNGRQLGAHVVAYRRLVGPIPEGLVLDHLCRNPRCVNPDHLEPVTQRENVVRGEAPAATNARKTHCKRGHEFTPENTIDHPRGRNCRECGRLMKERRRAKARAEGRKPV